MNKVETCFLEYQKHKQMVWFCYIDVTFLTWTYREQKLKQFLKELNKIYPNLIFMHQPGEGKDSGLNSSISLSNGKLCTDPHVKAIDCQIHIIKQYLKYASSCLNHNKKKTIYSQVLHLSRLCSCE